MDIHKLIHEACGATRHWHFPLLVGLIGFIKIIPKADSHERISDLGDVPGDNILPSQILISISSRRGLEARF